jgi:hypothetical protein
MALSTFIDTAAWVPGHTTLLYRCSLSQTTCKLKRDMPINPTRTDRITTLKKSQIGLGIMHE